MLKSAVEENAALFASKEHSLQGTLLLQQINSLEDWRTGKQQGLDAVAYLKKKNKVKKNKRRLAGEHNVYPWKAPSFSASAAQDPDGTETTIFFHCFWYMSLN